MENNLIMNDNINNKYSVSKLDKVIFYLVIIDILFLPYITRLSASISMIILPIWYIGKYKEVIIPKNLIILLGLSFTSYIISIIIQPKYIKINFIYFVILTYGLLYYVFFKHYFKNMNFRIDKLLFYYITFTLVLSLIYNRNPSLYFIVRSFWTMNKNIISIEDSLLIHRFTSTYSDPNNAAICFIAIYSYLIFNNKTRGIKHLYIMIATIFIVFSTMSSTGIVMLLLILAIDIIYSFIRLTNENINTIELLIFILFIIIGFPIIILFLFKYIDFNILRMSIYRFSINSSSSRLRIWSYLLKNDSIFKYLILGNGGSIIIDNIKYKPHNGHLHMIYNYGAISYSIFLSIFFRVNRKKKFIKYIVIIIFFVGFTMNVGIYEPRFINLLSLLAASYHYTN